MAEERKYSEKKGNKPFDWNVFLDKELHTGWEWDKAKSKAASWVTCACGNQCHIIPRRRSGQPVDIELRDLGYKFCWAIENEDTSGAKELLEQIELRSAELIKEIKDGKERI